MSLEETLKNNFDLDIISIIKNEESTDGNVYNIKTKDNKYIIKIYDDKDKAINMINIHNYLKDLYIPRITENKNNTYITKYNNSYIVMYSFLEGIQVCELNNIYSKDVIKSIANEVRRMHDITLNKDFNLKKIKLFDNLERKSLLHFDLTKGNIFMNNDKIGFIDFDDSKYGDSVCDIAILISFLFVSKKKGIDNESINVFLDNYYKEDEEYLRKIEIPYIKKYIKDWVDYVLDGHSFDSSLKGSFEFKKISADKIEIR